MPCTETVPFIERLAMGYYSSKEVKKRKVVKGFTTLRQYAQQRGWVSESDKAVGWKRKQIGPTSDKIGPLSRGEKKATVGTKDKETFVDSGEVIVPTTSVVEEVEEVVGITQDGVHVRDDEKVHDNTSMEASIPGDAGLQSGLDEAGGREHQAGGLLLEEKPSEGMAESSVGLETPRKGGGEALHCVPVGANTVPCPTSDYRTNHKWEDFRSSNYVITGKLKGGKCCIGVNAAGKLCGRQFVAKLLENKKNISETECRPTEKNPVFGCTRCGFAMCQPCQSYYEWNVRMQSPDRKRQKVDRLIK